MNKEIIKKMDCPVCGMNHDKYATKENCGISLRCSCGAVSSIIMQLGDYGVEENVDNMPYVFSLHSEDENIDNRIVTALMRAFDSGLRLTDYMGGLEDHTSISDIDNLLDWVKQEGVSI